jgi:hypothetical protein
MPEPYLFTAMEKVNSVVLMEIYGHKRLEISSFFNILYRNGHNEIFVERLLGSKLPKESKRREHNIKFRGGG